MNLADVMGEVGDALETIEDLKGRVFRYPSDNVAPPAAIVGLPDEITYDETYGRGSDRLSVPVFVLVSRADMRVAVETLAAYCDGSGFQSVKAAIDNHDYTACDTVRVASATFDVVPVAGVEQLTVEFILDVFGSGA